MVDEHSGLKNVLGFEFGHMSTSTHRSLCLNLLVYFEATLFDKF